MSKPVFVEPMLDKDDIASLILASKKKADLTWEGIAEQIGMSPVWTHSACMGMNSMPKEIAEVTVKLFDLPEEAVGILTEAPTKEWASTTPTDPCLYRLHEAVSVYGPSIKALIHEKFGDGIMSAIDFDMTVDRVVDPKGDRVKIEMSGKYLAYNSW